MSKGRKKTPTELKLIQGNPGKRPINENEPKPGRSEYDAPVFLEVEAKEIWDEEAPRLIEIGILTEADRSMFGAYCQKRADWLYYTRKAKGSSEIVKSPSGYPMQNPYISLANKAFEQMIKVAVEFGITPSSRSKVLVDDTGRRKPGKADAYF